MTDQPTASDLEPDAMCRELGDGRAIWLRPQLFNFLLIIGKTDDEGFDDCWEYQDINAALTAFALWDGNGEPHGWYRHPPTGRRRPDGDATKEYVQL